jgi:hypothetical protein
VRTISPSNLVRQPDLRYLDGGQSKTVRQSLEPLLAEIAEKLQADVCLALCESFSSARETCMLAAVAVPFVGLRLPNEPLVIKAASRSASGSDVCSEERTAARTITSSISRMSVLGCVL